MNKVLMAILLVMLLVMVIDSFSHETGIYTKSEVDEKFHDVNTVLILLCLFCIASLIISLISLGRR